MIIVETDKIKGTLIPEPEKRRIKIIFAPDSHKIDIMSFSIIDLFPGSKTSYHNHINAELIYILKGKGTAVSDDKKVPIKENSAIWIESRENHGIENNCDEIMNMVTVYIPGADGKDVIKKAKLDSRKKTVSKLIDDKLIG